MKQYYCLLHAQVSIYLKVMKTAAVSSRLRYANYKAELAGKRMSLIRQYIKGDRIIWTVILVLFMISLLSVYSSTGSLAYKNMSGDTMYYLFRQFKFILLG